MQSASYVSNLLQNILRELETLIRIKSTGNAMYL